VSTAEGSGRRGVVQEAAWARHRLDRRVLGGERRPAARAVFHGAVAATVGKLSWVIWTLSIAMASFNLSPMQKSPAVSQQGRRNLDLTAPSVGCGMGSSLRPFGVCNCLPGRLCSHRLGARGRIYPECLFAPDSMVNTWQLTLLISGRSKPA